MIALPASKRIEKQLKSTFSAAAFGVAKYASALSDLNGFEGAANCERCQPKASFRDKE